MFMLLSVIAVCVTILIAINRIQKNPIMFIIHRKYEEINNAPSELSKVDKTALEEYNSQLQDGLQAAIKLGQDFLGGDTTDATTEYETE